MFYSYETKNFVGIFSVGWHHGNLITNLIMLIMFKTQSSQPQTQHELEQHFSKTSLWWSYCGLAWCLFAVIDTFQVAYIYLITFKSTKLAKELMRETSCHPVIRMTWIVFWETGPTTGLDFLFHYVTSNIKNRSSLGIWYRFKQKEERRLCWLLINIKLKSNMLQIQKSTLLKMVNRTHLYSPFLTIGH